MKLQLEVTNVEHAGNRVTLKPINCALKGDLIYQLPRRAVETCVVGAVVETSIPLPDQYRILMSTRYDLNDPLKHGNEKTHSWKPIESAPVGIWLLVSAGIAKNPGGIDVVIARLDRRGGSGVAGYWETALSGGSYQGAKLLAATTRSSERLRGLSQNV
jgi:hypothetical protein